MTLRAGAPVVAGVDGSAHQQMVIEWAVTEARLRRRPLRLVHAYSWAVMGASHDAPPYGAVQAQLHERAEEILAEALAAARTAAPELEISGRIVDGGPGGVLIAESRTAALVVVGHRGHGGFTELLIGAVATQVATHAASPVVVVRPRSGTGPHAGRIVVGVDGSPLSDAAVGFGFEEASLRGTGLTAVHAWTGPVSTGPGDMLPLVYDTNDVRDEETRVLAESTAGWRERYPDVDLDRVVVRDRARHALINAAAGAALLVVGSHGRGGVLAGLLGSVSHAVLHRAPAPVVVVRPAAD